MAIRGGIAWLASSQAEITRARGVLEALRKPGVIDELGLLMLLGAFADHLYPAVTTVMTRARYLVFVPAIYQFLEHSRRASGKDADRIARDLQYDLRNALLKNESNVIGKEAGRLIVRTPSSIYWSALGALGIAVQRMSESSYQKKLSANVMGLHVLKDDDDAAHGDEAESLWTPDLRLSHVMSNGAFPESTSFRLRVFEAAFLEARYARLRPSNNESLVTALVGLGRRHGASSLDEIAYPWEIPALSEGSALVVEQARLLSLFARGTTLQYYRMLIEKRGDDDPGVAEAFVTWFGQAQADLAGWDIDGFFRLLRGWGADRRPLRDREFIRNWIERCRASRSARAALLDTHARAIVGGREDYVRRGKQRLRVQYQLDTWRNPFDPATGLYQLDYRHRVGRQIARDIVEGLEGGQA